MKKYIQKILFILFLAFFSSCNILNYNAHIKMTEDYISSSRGLVNGIRFEKLIVNRIGEDGYPTEYKTTLRFQCYNPGVDGIQEYWPKKLYFKKENGHYLWNADTVNINYTQGPQFSIRKRMEEREDEMEFHYDEMFLSSSKTYNTSPIEFESKTWYFMDLQDPTLNGVYLFIDDELNFNIFKVNSGVSPI